MICTQHTFNNVISELAIMSKICFPIFEFHQGNTPLLVSMPHAGTCVPNELAQAMTDTALRLPDTDWHLPRLYTVAIQLGASVLIANYSRYVIDLNRPPDNTSLYPGQSVTGLCPVDTFADEPIYHTDTKPGNNEIVRRRKTMWQPYHDKIKQELTRIHRQHNCAVLWDAHSIRSEVPRFFYWEITRFKFRHRRWKELCA